MSKELEFGGHSVLSCGHKAGLYTQWLEVSDLAIKLDACGI